MSDDIQLTLITDPVAVWPLQHIKLDEIVPNDLIKAGEPPAELITDIARRFLISPLTVYKHPSGLWYPLAGKRRVKALRRLAAVGHKMLMRDENGLVEVPTEDMKIPVMIWEGTPESYYRLEWAAQHLASDNKLADLSAIRQAQEELNTSDPLLIARHLGAKPAVILKLLRLGRLNSDILQAYKEGRITGAMVNTLSKASDNDLSIYQTLILDALAEGKKVTMATITNRRLGSVQKYLSTFEDMYSQDTQYSRAADIARLKGELEAELPENLLEKFKQLVELLDNSLL